MSVVICGLSPAPLKFCDAITRSPPNCLLTVSSIAAFTDAANTVNSVTTATPTMSADAVAAVRRGLRIALSRARRPVILRKRAIGAPNAAAAGCAAIGPRTTMPTIVKNAPNPAGPRPAPPIAAATTSTMPATVNSTPRLTRTTEIRVFSMATSRSAASGGTRDARIAGTTVATSVTIMPTANAAITVDGFTVSAPLVMPAPRAWNSARKPAASGDPDDQAEDRRDETDRGGFERDRAEHLGAGRADRAQERRLARALGDDDRERVVDAERRDEQRDEREHQQERLEEAEERLVDVVVVLLGELLARDGFDTARQDLLEVRDELLLTHALLRRDVDVRDLVGAGHEQLLRFVERERDVRDRAETVLAADRQDADDLHLRRIGREHGDRVADGDVLVLGDLLVDRDLARGLGRPALVDGPRVEAGIGRSSSRRSSAARCRRSGCRSCRRSVRSRSRSARPARTPSTPLIVSVSEMSMRPRVSV